MIGSLPSTYIDFGDIGSALVILSTVLSVYHELGELLTPSFDVTMTCHCICSDVIVFAGIV